MRLLGCDRALPRHSRRSLPDAELRQGDFFDLNSGPLFDVVLMNPPFIRHHRLSKAQISKYQNAVKDVLPLKRTADLWAYFLVMASNHLRKGGSLGAILPWSFLAADYAVEVRRWISQRFRSVRIRVLWTSQFEETRERVVVLWLKGHGARASRVSMEYAREVGEQSERMPLSISKLVSGTINTGPDGVDPNDILRELLDKRGFTCLDQYAKISIGVVTGANKFFVMPPARARELGIPSRWRVPILSNSGEFRGLHFNGYRPLSSLIHFPSTSKVDAVKKYVQRGRRAGIDKLTHSLPRQPWFHIPREDAPDAFFPYRVSDTPYLAMNDSDVQSTNAIHRVYFKGLTQSQRGWIQMSLLADPAQMFIEAKSRVYGRGYLKMEPGVLKGVPVFVADYSPPSGIIRSIDRCLALGKKGTASAIATATLCAVARLDERLSKRIAGVIAELRLRRLGRKLVRSKGTCRGRESPSAY